MDRMAISPRLEGLLKEREKININSERRRNISDEEYQRQAN